MPITEPYELDGVLISTTEISIVSGTSTLQTKTDAGIYSLLVDPVGAGMVKGDRFAVRVYEKVELTGGVKRLALMDVISHAQTEIRAYPPLILKNGWDMTIQKLNGVDRNWDASIRATASETIITEPYELDGVTVGGAELSITGGTTTLLTKVEPGFYQLWVDGFNLLKADKFQARIYETVEGTGGVKRRLFEMPLQHAQPEVFYSPILLLKNGWEMTLQKSSGIDRAFDASIRKVA